MTWHVLLIYRQLISACSTLMIKLMIMDTIFQKLFVTGGMTRYVNWCQALYAIRCAKCNFPRTIQQPLVKIHLPAVNTCCHHPSLKNVNANIDIIH